MCAFYARRRRLRRVTITTTRTRTTTTRGKRITEVPLVEAPVKLCTSVLPRQGYFLGSVADLAHFFWLTWLRQRDSLSPHSPLFLLSLSSSMYKSQLKLALFTLSLNKTHKKCFALVRSACTSDDYHHYEITATTTRRTQAQQEHTKAILHITPCLCVCECVGGFCSEHFSARLTEAVP